MAKPGKVVNNKMMAKRKIVLGILAVFFLAACHKKVVRVEVDAYVYITKAVDTLPCEANIEYTDFTNGKQAEQISGNWAIHHNLHYDQYVTLKATGTSNIKTIRVEIMAKGSTESKSCSGNCTIDVRKDLYN